VNFKIVGAILRKDALSLLPLVIVTSLLFLGDAFITRLDLLPVWTEYGQALLLVALFVLVLSVFQLDSPASLTDDWLCRPVRIRELLAAKFALVLTTTWLARALGVFAADLGLGFPLTESVLDAALPPEGLFAFMLPIFLFAAIVTRTFAQGFGVLFAIFIGVFVLPTPFVRPPGPLTPGIRDGLWLSGMAWLSTLPARLMCLVLLVVGLWLVYRRRRLQQARVLLAVTVCVALSLLVMPMAWLSWDATFALQKASGPAPVAAAGNIWLRNPYPCFPAARRAELAGPAFDAARRKAGLTLWDEEPLRDVGPDSVAFLTSIEPRGLPLDWRAKLAFVQARFMAGGATLYSLRPARYLTDSQGDGPLSHAWMLPEPVVQRLRDSRIQLQLSYSLTLLEPHEFRVRADGERHEVPGLGFCSADLKGNHIDVDCFSTSHPAQISAELNDIPASRVYGGVDFAPRWATWPYSQRVKLSIGSPRLARHDSITVTAWSVAGYVDESLTLPGILGAELAVCPLPVYGENAFQKSRWSDTAPHAAHLPSVDQGVQLEVLDFGGTGSTIVLLPGLGATAHSYDELGPQLAKTARVIAITRRGAGYSSKTDFGFDTPRLSQDVLAVMDQMNLQKVLLVGHSIAGEELTWLGGHHPERFSGLIYLDAAYDRSGSDRNSRLRQLNASLPPEPPVPPEAFLNYEALSNLLEQRGHTHYPEGELIAFLNADKPFVAGTPSIDARTQQAILAAVEAPDYARVKIPALAIYAFPDPDKPLPPWYDSRDAKLVANLAEIRAIGEAAKRKNIELFRRGVKMGEVLELQDATHNLVLSNPRQVLEAIEHFSAHIAPGR